MKAETTVEIIEKDHVLEDKKIVGKFYVQKTRIAFRKAAVDKLKKIGPYGDVEQLVDPSTLEKVDRQWGRYNQGITFDEENLESLIKDKLFKDKDQAKISKLEKEKRSVGDDKKDLKKMDKKHLLLQNTGQVSFRVTDVYFSGNLDNKDEYRANEDEFRAFVDQLKKGCEEKMGKGTNIKLRIHLRHNKRTNKFNGTVNFNFEEEHHANEFYNYIDGKDFNNFILRPEWIEQRRMT